MNIPINKNKVHMFSAIVVLLFAQMVQAASFDCAKATTKAEHIICDDKEISKLDDELSVRYKAALKDLEHAETIKHEQKQWIKARNLCAEAVCLQDAYVRRIEKLRMRNEVGAQKNEFELIDVQDKPGYYRLDKSNNDGVCRSLGRIINADIMKFGKPRLNGHDEFVKWHVVDEKEIDRGAERRYGGKVERADADINNDGIVELIVKTKWMTRGVESDAINIFPPSRETKIEITKLFNNMIEFNSTDYWLDRYQKKYGTAHSVAWDWFFTGIASIDLFRHDKMIYVVAQNHAVPNNISAKIFVFQLDKDNRKYEEKDVCMFVRTCACSGCDDVRGTTEENRHLPADKWCRQ